jgi:hypothetical protein
MLDKDKLWIVAYVSVKGMCKSRAYQLLAEFRNHYKFDESVNMIIVPVEEPTRIEFYNLEKAEPTSIEKLKELMNYAEPETI